MTGKISTKVLFVSLIVLVLMPNIGTTAVNVITGVDFLFLLISFCDYIRVYFTHSPMIQPIHKKDEE
jgi:hypothetical protein